MKKIFLQFFFFYILFTSSSWACPGCAGSMDNPRDKYTVYILMVFIGLTYIPFYILYRTVYKYRKSVLTEGPSKNGE